MSTGVYILGWIGTAIYLGNYAYLGLATRFRRRRYFAANALAAALLTASSLALETWQSVIINGFWVVVSVLALRGTVFKIKLLNRYHLRSLVGVMLAASLVLWLHHEKLAIGLLGWSSVCAFCGSYLLFSGRLLANDEFHLFNACAAAVILPQLWLDDNWPVLALEACWLVLSLISFSRHQQKGMGLPAEIEDGHA